MPYFKTCSPNNNSLLIHELDNWMQKAASIQLDASCTAGGRWICEIRPFKDKRGRKSVCDLC